MKLHFRPISPFFWGVGTLANLSGNYVTMDEYMNGDNISDMRKDLHVLNKDMKKAIKSFSFKGYVRK